MNPHYYGLILAGGRGTRFWPRSRKRTAKQVLNVAGERSLIQATVDRLAAVIPPERLWILTNHHLRDTIIGQLPDVPANQILAEPAQRNTAPAIGLAAAILGSVDPEAVMGVFPADHVVADAETYAAVIQTAMDSAAAGRLMVVGIAPRWPETGYGYVEFPGGTAAGASLPVPVLRFHEKPNAERAQRYLEAGNFYWNSGMFFWRAEALLDQLRLHLPATAAILDGLPPFFSPDFEARLEECFPHCENISIDYAVLEKAAEVRGIPAADFGWNDVGSWNAVYELVPRDGEGNAIQGGGESVLLDARNNLVDARGKLVALLGVNDLIVVDTPDALLVASRDQAQRVSEIVKALERRNREDLL
jgi:mannose-1-phosphate guanylyltransferase